MRFMIIVKATQNCEAGIIPDKKVLSEIGTYNKQLIEAGALAGDLDYRVLEYAGELDQFSLAARAALCSSPTEMRAYGVFFPPSAAILEQARAQSKKPFAPVYADVNAQYETACEIDVSALEPQVATPGGVQNAVKLSRVAGTRVSHARSSTTGCRSFHRAAPTRRLSSRKASPPAAPGRASSSYQRRRTLDLTKSPLSFSR